MDEPISAGTYNYTINDCSCSGSTIKYSPHPISVEPVTNREIIQLTSITIGGPNGLNN